MRLQLEGKSSPDLCVKMEALSREYGWTPTEIREQPLEDIEAYFEIIRMRNKLESRKLKQMK